MAHAATHLLLEPPDARAASPEDQRVDRALRLFRRAPSFLRGDEPAQAISVSKKVHRSQQRRHSTSVIAERNVREAFRRRRSLVLDSRPRPVPTGPCESKESPHESDHNLILRWEMADASFTSWAFLTWSVCVLLLAGSHVVPSTDVAVVATPAVALLGVACVAIFNAPTRSTASTPELPKPLCRRPSLSPTTPASPATPVFSRTTAVFDGSALLLRSAAPRDKLPPGASEDAAAWQ
ncbi:hypothetical protein T484DRAFT_1941074 [Baffinella frigidus]|nr:hypothetical protein T484DRAFT_1941074 [Cryptophyta sp. CCMP2293]